MADYAIHEETLVDVSNVIRKKDGTSALIDPADYADRINLMGMLEEKTVSGTIATFADGADAVPLKKCEITLPASLDGYTEIDVVHTGKNFLEIKNKAAGGLTGAVNSDGEYVISGIATSTVYFDFYGGTANGITLDAGKYTFSIDGLQTGVSATWTRNGAWAGSISSSTTINLTAQAMISGYIVVSNGTDLSTPITLKCMFEKGDTASDFEPYSGTTHTASLGRTIYGGTADVVNGHGTNENRKFTVTSPTFDDSIRFIGSGNTAYIQINSSPASNNRWQDLACSHFTPANIYAGGTQQGIGCYASQFYIRDSRFTSKQDFIDFLTEQETLGTPLEICYKLATPSDFTFDPVPIDSKLGNNTIWSEQGDTEVTYRSMGTVYQYPEGEGVSF